MSEEDEGYRELKWKTARHEKEVIKTKLRGLRTQQMFNYYSCKKNYHNSRLLYNKNMISKNKLVINILNRLKYVRISLFLFHSSNNCWTILILLRRGVSTSYVSIVNTSVPMNSFDWHDISKSIKFSVSMAFLTHFSQNLFWESSSFLHKPSHLKTAAALLGAYFYAYENLSWRPLQNGRVFGKFPR